MSASPREVFNLSVLLYCDISNIIRPPLSMGQYICRYHIKRQRLPLFSKYIRQIYQCDGHFQVVAFGEYVFAKITAFLVKRNLQIEENKTSGTCDGCKW